MRITTGYYLLIYVIILCSCQVNPAESSKEASPENPGDQPAIVVSATLERQAASQLSTTEPRLELQPSPTNILKAEQPEDIKPVQLCSPLQGFSLEELPEIVSSPYAPPPPGHEERHHGVDFSFYQRGERTSIEGVSVQTVLAGQVAAVIPNRFPYGNMVIIETRSADLNLDLRQDLQVVEGEALYLLYAHMAEEPQVEVGEAVPACYPLGSVGRSGNAGVAHLHLETRLGPAGAKFSGMAYYTTKSTQEERDQYELWRTSGVFQHFDPLKLLMESAR